MNHILASRSWDQLKKTFEMYREDYGTKFGTSVKIQGYENWYKATLLAIFQYAMDPNLFFAKALKRDIGRETPTWENFYGVARVFAWRSEIDLEDIAHAFEVKYQKSLEKYIRKYIQEEYAKNTLLCILQSWQY